MRAIALLNRERLIEAFTLLGEDLARRGAFIELAVCGGSAIMLRFAWRRGTEDVDAVVRPGYDEALLAPSVRKVADVMALSADWLNDAVGMFTPLDEDDTLFEAAGSYPPGDRPGLRVLVAKPHYLLAMKLQALSNLDRGDRDLSDARGLARHLGMSDEEALRRLYRSVHEEDAPAGTQRQFAAVLAAAKPGAP